MNWLFYALAALSLVSALLMIGARGPVNSVIALIVCFISIAGHYILLNAQFLAVVHVIVYTGAIMVLFLFVIMLLNLNRTVEKSKPLLTRVSAVIAGGAFLLVLLAATRHGLELRAANPHDPSIGLVHSVGRSLFGEFLFPFEASSVLFLSAMVGAMVLARKAAPLAPAPDAAGPGPRSSPGR